MHRLRLLGVDLHAVSESETIQLLLWELSAGHGGWVITPNLDHLRRYRHNPSFAVCFQSADLVVADGMPLVWAAWLQGTPLPGRVAGSSLIWTLSAAAAQKGRSIFLLGGDPGTAEEAAKVLAAKCPGLRVAGTVCPPVGFESDAALIGELRQKLQDAKPDIVFVALGSPKQEYFIASMRDSLPSAWWLGVGISFSFVTGRVKRAPIWMQKTGLEWLHRLIQEPHRLFRRYIIEDLPFAAVLFTSALIQRIKSSRRRRIN